MPTCPPLYVSPPTVEPYGYGLFSVAQFPVETDRHWRCGVQWEPYACTPARALGDQCDFPGVEKEVDDGVPLVEASAFTVYGGYLCRLPGRPQQADIEDRIRQAIRLGEQRIVERTFWSGDLGNTPFLASPDAVVLNAVDPPTAADALSPVAGIAALESFLRENYGGTGVIHAPAGAVPLLAHYNQLRPDGGAPLRTWLGTPIAAGGGYVINTGPDGTPAPPGTSWLYATGPVAIRRGEIFINPNTVAQALNRTTNEVEILAEREYVIGFDCLLAAVLITLSC